MTKGNATHIENIFNYNVFKPFRFEQFSQCFSFTCRSNRSTDKKACVKEFFDDPGGDVTTCTSYQDLSGCYAGHRSYRQYQMTGD